MGGAGSTLGEGRRVAGARTESPAAAGPGETLGRRFCVGLTERPGEPRSQARGLGNAGVQGGPRRGVTQEPTARGPPAAGGPGLGSMPLGGVGSCCVLGHAQATREPGACAAAEGGAGPRSCAWSQLDRRGSLRGLASRGPQGPAPPAHRAPSGAVGSSVQAAAGARPPLPAALRAGPASPHPPRALTHRQAPGPAPRRCQLAPADVRTGSGQQLVASRPGPCALEENMLGHRGCPTTRRGRGWSRAGARHWEGLCCASVSPRPATASAPRLPRPAPRTAPGWGGGSVQHTGAELWPPSHRRVCQIPASRRRVLLARRAPPALPASGGVCPF